MNKIYSREDWDTYQGNLGKDPDSIWYNQFFGKVYLALEKGKEFFSLDRTQFEKTSKNKKTLENKKYD
ncbi:MAG: hypothetical protein NUV46_03280 [Nanoarchaeota archaeon]|nr:hypothetical protein [Nanoarchaeota archaeon]